MSVQEQTKVTSDKPSTSESTPVEYDSWLACNNKCPSSEFGELYCWLRPHKDGLHEARGGGIWWP